MAEGAGRVGSGRDLSADRVGLVAGATVVGSSVQSAEVAAASEQAFPAGGWG